MPTYEFQCSDCGERFELFLSIRQKESQDRFACPSCGGTNTTQLLHCFNFITGGGTPSGGSSRGSCSGPCPPSCSCGN